MKLKNFLRIRWEPESRKSFFHLFPQQQQQQGVLGSRVFCCWWLCHLVHGPGKKHPLPSPSGNLDYQDFDDLWPFLWLVCFVSCSLEIYVVCFLWLPHSRVNWIIWITKNNQILFSTSCSKKPIINTKCHTIDISIFIWLNSISFNFSIFCFLFKISLPDCPCS